VTHPTQCESPNARASLTTLTRTSPLDLPSYGSCAAIARWHRHHHWHQTPLQQGGSVFNTVSMMMLQKIDLLTSPETTRQWASTSRRHSPFTTLQLMSLHDYYDMILLHLPVIQSGEYTSALHSATVPLHEKNYPYKSHQYKSQPVQMHTFQPPPSCLSPATSTQQWSADSARSERPPLCARRTVLLPPVRRAPTWLGVCRLICSVSRSESGSAR
jgi:hypothetical protein